MARTAVSLISSFALFGCTTVEVQYKQPSSPATYDSAAKDADSRYEYFVLTRNSVLVSQAPDSSDDKKKDQGSTSRTNDSTSDAPHGAVPMASASPASPSARGGTASPGTSAGSTAPTGATNPKPSKSGQPETKAPSKGAATTSGDKAPPSFDNPLGAALIDGKKWTATVVPIPDNRLALMVRGETGFWKNTTLGIVRFQNTDVVSSVSITAENLVPTRIAQVAGIAASVVKIGTGVLAMTPGERIPPRDLEPFVIDVGRDNASGNVNDDWRYSFEFDDATPPAAAISIEDFRTQVAGKKVGFWPVPACRPATVKLTRKSSGSQYAFHVVVASPDHVRLQPLPVTGKMELGSVCGASVTGTAAADALATISDDLQAAQKAVETLTAAKKGSGGSSQSGASTGQ
jgi:hypothetical protein